MVKSSDAIRLSSLTLEELDGAISLYPWFSAARAELCRRMSELGSQGWGEGQYAEQALYFCSRSIAAGFYAKSLEKAPDARVRVREKPAERQVFVVGGDYFSPQQYEELRKDDGDIFSLFASQARDRRKVDYSDYCTESLAKVYLDQGYTDKAKEIYSKLSLRYPEKIAYFAALIEKIDSEEQKI